MSLPCLRCGVLVESGSYCRRHRSSAARGYGREHRLARIEAIKHHPWCTVCGHAVDPVSARCAIPGCPKCPLQLDHVDPIRGGRTPDSGRRQVLCAVCNRQKSDS